MHFVSLAVRRDGGWFAATTDRPIFKSLSFEGISKYLFGDYEQRYQDTFIVRLWRSLAYDKVPSNEETINLWMRRIQTRPKTLSFKKSYVLS